MAEADGTRRGQWTIPFALHTEVGRQVARFAMRGDRTIPFVADRAIGADLRDDFELPDYE